MGLVSRVVADDKLTNEVDRIAHEFAASSPESLAEIKRLVSSAYGSLHEGLEQEIDAVMRQFASPRFSQSLRTSSRA